MGLNKGKSTTAVAPAPAATPAQAAAAPAQTPASDNGTQAAISRLKKTTDTSAAPAASKGTGYQSRDFDKEARGKTRCVQFEAALMSPAIAGMKFDTMEQYLALCKQAADFGTAYTFGETK